MKKNSQGFSVIEAMVILLIVSVVGFVAYRVFNGNETNSADGDKSQVAAPKPDGASTTYDFDVLGISMDILPGWEVSKETTEVEGFRGPATNHTWRVEHPEVGLGISLSSRHFLGGFQGCTASGSLKPAVVTDIADTRNSELRLLSWQTTINGQRSSQTLIVRSKNEHFKRANDINSPAIAMRDIEPGEYFYCRTEPGPGMALDLSGTTGSSNIESIRAYRKNPSSGESLSVTPDDAGYAEVKAMLTSIK